MAAGATKMRELLDDQTADSAIRSDSLPPLGDVHEPSGRYVLCTKRTLPSAQAAVREFYTFCDARTLVAHHGTFMQWRGNRYTETEDATLRHQLHPWLHGALRLSIDKRAKMASLVDFEANPTTVNAVLESLRNLTHLPESIAAPCWLDGRDGPPPREIIACESLNLHVPTGTVSPATPLFFTFNALDYDFDPDAPPPTRWLAFLTELFSDDAGVIDRESIDLLQEFIGYLLTGDTSQQKALLGVGPRRSGKGTMGRVITSVVGAGNVANPTTASLAGAFGLQPLLGRSLAIVSDARFSGEGTAIVVERVLNITGEDSLTVDRKFKSSITTKLPTRFIFLTNELPRFNDSSTALAGRFLILRLTKSFYGKEDPTLTDQLMAERPGILLWAIEGLRRLRARGRFVQPKSADEAIRDLEDLASPVGAFVRDNCITGPGYRVDVDNLYRAWKVWSESEGRTAAGPRTKFGRDLLAAVPGVKRKRGTGDVPFYEGIGLKGAL